MASTETVTILFTDLVGSTALLDRHGPEAAERLRREHVTRLRSAVATSGGREIKNVGDGLMVAFASAAAGVACAVDMQRREAAVSPGPELRVGISAGDAEVDGNDYFGTPVIEASRLCAAASGGQILVSELVRLLAGGRGAYAYAATGPIELKGFDQPVQAFEVTAESSAGAARSGGLDVPLPSLLSLDPAVPFVARPAPWDDLEGAWAQASRGARQAVLVGGEAGTGKTRMVTEFARVVHRRGGLVLYGLCTDDFELPYQPFVEALGHLLSVVDADTARRLAGRGAGDLAKLLPRLGADAGTSASLGGSEADRFRLFEAVLEILANLGRLQPVLLVLDDIHWARRPTVQLLEHLLRSPGLSAVCLIGTYRNAPADIGEPLREALPDLRRLAGVQRVTVEGFDAPGVREYVGALAGHEVGRALEPVVKTFVATTGGNAFLISELWRHLVETGRLTRAQGRWTISGRLDVVESPEAVRDVVGKRLAVLPAATRSVLELAAVAGASFDLEVIADAASLSTAAALQALEPALAARLIEEAAGGTFRFGHALVQRSVEDGLRASERRLRHLHVGEALARRHGDRLDELAHHFLAAVPLEPAPVAVSYARRAAQEALRAVAYEHAVSLLETALPLTTTESERADLLLDLAEARMKAGDTEGSTRASASAAQLARHLGDGAGLVRAAMLYEGATWRGAHYGVDAEALVREALPHASDEQTRVRLLASQSSALAFSGHDDEALATARSAIDAARVLGDPATLSAALQSPLFASWEPHTFVFQDACAREMGELAAQLGDDEAKLGATNKMIIAPMLRGRMPELHDVLTEHNRLAAKVRQPLFFLLEAQVRSIAALCEGRLDEAERWAEEAGQWGHLLPHAVGGYGVQIFEIRRAQGRLDEVRPVVEAVARFGSESGTWPAGLAVLYAELGMLDQAAALLPPLLAGDLATVPRDSLWCGSLSYLATAAAATGDRDAAAILYPKILPYRGLTLLTPGLASYGAADRYLGTLAAVLQRPREAIAHLEAAVAFDDDGGAVMWAAHSRYELGRLLAQRSTNEDRVRAARLLEESLSRAEVIGMAGLVQRGRIELDRLESGRVPPLDVGLTTRENAVLRLLAEGRTNREIGTALNMSQHTAANHVRAILLKTGSGNRTEAAAWAIRRGLLSERPT